VSISDVQTLGDFGGGSTADDDGGTLALRTPLYLIIAALGAAIAVGTFLPWAGVQAQGQGTVIGDPVDGFVTSVTGFDAGGWGLSALIAGAAIVLLGVLGYLWNPFSDPEAVFVAVFAAVTAVAALFKILDAASLFPVAGDFDAPNTSVRLGLWVILIAATLALLSALWILYSRPKAQARLT